MSDTAGSWSFLRSAPLVYLISAGMLAGLLVVSLYLSLPFYLVASLPVVVAAGFFLASRPRLAVYCTLVLTFVPVAEIGPTTPFQLMAALAVVAAAADMALRKVLPRLSPLFPLYLTFGGIVILSVTWASQVPLVYLSAYVWLRGLALFLLLLNYLDTRRRLWTALGILVAMAILNAMIATTEYVLAGGGTYRPRALMGNPNSLAFVLAMAAVVTFSLTIEPGALLRRLSAAGATLLLMVTIAVTGSRGGTAALVAGLLALACMNLRRWPWFLGLVAAALAVAPLIPTYYWERVANIGTQALETVDVGEAYLTDRGQLNRAAIEMWKDHPVLGVGAGQYMVHLGLTRYNPGFKPGIELSAHNLYLETLSENGVVGFVVLLAMICLVAYRLVLTWRQGRLGNDDPIRQLSSIIAGAFAAFLVFGMTGSLLYQKPIHMILAFAMCVAALPGAPWFRGQQGFRD